MGALIKLVTGVPLAGAFAADVVALAPAVVVVVALPAALVGGAAVTTAVDRVAEPAAVVGACVVAAVVGAEVIVGVDLLEFTPSEHAESRKAQASAKTIGRVRRRADDMRLFLLLQCIECHYPRVRECRSRNHAEDHVSPAVRCALRSFRHISLCQPLVRACDETGLRSCIG